jgi:hypothetical protein
MIQRYWLVIICLFLTACTSQEVSYNPKPDHKYKPSLDVKVEVIDNDVTVKVNTDMKIAKEQYGHARKLGEGHIHMYLNEGEKIGVKTNLHMLEDLVPGNYKLKVSLHNNDHTPYDVTRTIEFEIK